MDKQEQDFYKDLYEKMSKKYTKEELAESFVFPAILTPEEKAQADKELREHRQKRIANRTPREHMLAGLLRLKYQIKKALVEDFSEEKRFSVFLKLYLETTNRTVEQLAEDIALPLAVIEGFLLDRKGQTEVSLASLVLRLEWHSGEMIPSLLWWNLAMREMEDFVKLNLSKRDKEREKVVFRVYEG